MIETNGVLLVSQHAGSCDGHATTVDTHTMKGKVTVMLIILSMMLDKRFEKQYRVDDQHHYLCTARCKGDMVKAAVLGANDTLETFNRPKQSRFAIAKEVVIHT